MSFVRLGKGVYLYKQLLPPTFTLVLFSSPFLDKFFSNVVPKLQGAGQFLQAASMTHLISQTTDKTGKKKKNKLVGLKAFGKDVLSLLRIRTVHTWCLLV